MMIPFENVIEAQARGVVACDGEARRIGAVAGGETIAASAGVAHVAEGEEGGLVRLPGNVRNGPAEALPEIAQGQHGGAGVAGPDARLEGVKVGAGHFGGIVAQDMASTRLEILKSMVERNPGDSFARYGLAMEYRNTGDLAAAVGEFRSLIAMHPDYSAAYYHGGQTLERLGLPAEAREMYLQGIDATARKGDFHTRDEIQAALDLMG
jgi:tetratricopeptide (TPR) repeat protein